MCGMASGCLARPEVSVGAPSRKTTADRRLFRIGRPTQLPFSSTPALPRLRIVGDAGEQTPQLNHSRQLAVLFERGTDGSCLSLGDREHARSIGSGIAAGNSTGPQTAR